MVAALLWTLALAAMSASATGAPSQTKVIDESRPAPRPCSQIRNVTPYYLKGGCILEEVGWGVDAYVLTAIGEIKLAHCDLFIDIHVDGDGRAMVDGFGGAGGTCDRLNVCFSGANRLARVPFNGRLYRDRAGELHQHIDMCLDTTIGRFRGGFDIPLQDDYEGVWRSKRGISIPVGSSGMRLVGKWRLKRNIGDRYDETRRATRLSVRTRPGGPGLDPPG